MNNIDNEILSGVNERKSLDELDYESFNAGSPPMSNEAEIVELKSGITKHFQSSDIISLDGEWQLVENGNEEERLKGVWENAISARVPGSIHTALVEAGKIPDPTFGLNQEIARKESFKTWWMKRTFRCIKGLKQMLLVFGGIANRCTIWINGNRIGSHEGMFGGPEFEISQYLREENTLIVKLDPIPFIPVDPEGKNKNNNNSYRYTVVFNNVYGWHYANLPSLGIWRPVKIFRVPDVSIKSPFITTKDSKNGIMELLIHLESIGKGFSGKLKGSIEPDNFMGKAYHFEKELHCEENAEDLHLQFTIPDHHLWWPVDLGEPNLYLMKLSFTPDHNGTGDYKEFTFGIRTIRMASLPEGPKSEKYNWTFIVNGEPHFIKGTGWCTMDPLMDFSRERYNRLISLARMQHVQMLRGWGSGMPETDEFYDLCNRNGIMVLQEWPTGGNSHEEQPYEILEETVRINMLRLRNNPSLVMWGAGNESSRPFGPVIDMMGRLSIELDGTRPFHRAEPWGGSVHEYNCYWGRKHLDYNLNMTADFYGEFGLASMPAYESVQRYLPEHEKKTWPPRNNSAFAYHTPIFNTRDCISRLTQYSRYFVANDCTMEEFIIGSQLSQAVGVRHTLERARTRWPYCTGALYYKMNDNYPAASWACVDWYGAPKIGHYIFQDAFSPLHACVIFQTLNFAGTPVSLPVFLLDDANQLKDSEWQVVVRAYNSMLMEIKKTEFSGQGSIESPVKIGEFSLTFEETDTIPLLTVVEVRKDGKVADRTFYWTNYEADKGCLFKLPKTILSWTAKDGRVTVKNTGSIPAVAVEISCPGHLDTFAVSDNYFWLDQGEEIIVEVNQTENITINAWNYKDS